MISVYIIWLLPDDSGPESDVKPFSVELDTFKMSENRNFESIQVGEYILWNAYSFDLLEQLYAVRLH